MYTRPGASGPLPTLWTDSRCLHDVLFLGPFPALSRPFEVKFRPFVEHYIKGAFFLRPHRAEGARYPMICHALFLQHSSLYEVKDIHPLFRAAGRSPYRTAKSLNP